MTVLALSSTKSLAATIQPVPDWFEPTLSVDSEPVCGIVHQVLRERFWTDRALMSFDRRDASEFPGLTRVQLEDLPFEEVPLFNPNTGTPAKGTGRQTVVQDDGQPLYVTQQWFAGCGGACESYALMVSKQPIRAGYAGYPVSGQAVSATDASLYGWAVYRDHGSALYAVSLLESTVKVYKLQDPARFAVSCQIELAPDPDAQESDAVVTYATRSLQALEQAIDGLTRGAGDCGTLITAYRWKGYVHEALRQTLHRPWALREWSEETDGSYQDDMANLQKWALTGLSEHAALKRYLQQLDATTDVLASVYVQRLGLSAEESLTMARTALRTAASNGIRFYMYDPIETEAERALRSAIIARKPVSTIRRLATRELIQSLDHEEETDSILSVAIDYPEALSVLLERGADPNKANAFGKTPLMYAAQRNAVAAATALLAHGADPNARTFRPLDQCRYTLSSNSVSALHYAVRNAGPALIETLIDAGASLVLKATGPNGGPSEGYPLKWLLHYTDSESTEINPNIDSGQLPALIALLAVPAIHERHALARQLLKKAGVAYQQRKTELAFRFARDAVDADPGLLDAYVDLALFALRTNRQAIAARAALTVTQGSSDPGLRAAAFFNLGLACEMGIDDDDPSYQRLCDEPIATYFLKSWITQPAPSRRNKLNELFVGEGFQGCVIGNYPDVPQYFLITSYAARATGRDRSVTRVFIHHPLSVQVTGNEIEFTSRIGRQDFRRILLPEKIERHELDGFALTVIDADTPFSPWWEVAGRYCGTKR
jgi:hypothetical protein